MALTHKPMKESIPTSLSMVFDREEGNMNPGVTGLPAAVLQNIVGHNVAERKAETHEPVTKAATTGGGL